jgi:hypothetical protein
VHRNLERQLGSSPDEAFLVEARQARQRVLAAGAGAAIAIGADDTQTDPCGLVAGMVEAAGAGAATLAPNGMALAVLGAVRWIHRGIMWVAACADVEREWDGSVGQQSVECAAAGLAAVLNDPELWADDTDQAEAEAGAVQRWRGAGPGCADERMAAQD